VSCLFYWFLLLVQILMWHCKFIVKYHINYFVTIVYCDSFINHAMYFVGYVTSVIITLICRKLRHNLCEMKRNAGYGAVVELCARLSAVLVYL